MRVRRYLDTLPKLVVPVAERAMFVDVVLLPIVRNAALDDDVRALATGVLGTWGKLFLSSCCCCCLFVSCVVDNVTC
jgi:hypothetical protein